MQRHFLHFFAYGMSSTLAVLKAPMLLTLSIGFSWLVIDHLPATMAVIWLIAGTALDLFTGLLKAWAKNEYSTSYGFRRTAIKVGSYMAIVILVVIFVNLLGTVDPNHKYDLSILINAMLGFMTFVELFSVCENLAAAFPNSPMTKYVVIPLLKLLKGKLENANPINTPDKDTEDETKS